MVLWLTGRNTERCSIIKPVSHCCSPSGYRWAFSEKRARREARRYQRRGLDRTSRRIVQLLTLRGVEGHALLEVGGGVGAIQIELLKMGVTRAVSIEITPTYEEAAGSLLRRAGLEDRVERKVMDFAEGADDVEAADIVIMNRVICCYPDMPKLAAAAAAHSRQVLVLSFPKERRWTRMGVAVGNLLLRATRQRFQVFVHPPERILAIAEQHGLRTTLNEVGLFWQVAELQRFE
jgi:protein-L-isoaspartate O-methyltransferase